MIDIVFSIPIHQRLEVVVDQILNFRYFNPNCGIIFHLSKGFDYQGSHITKDQFKEICQELGNIFINPESVRTGFADIIQAHISNFKYISSFLDFKYFAICASNELFIRGGLNKYICDFDCGVMQVKLDYNKWPHGIKASKDIEFKNYLSSHPNMPVLFTYPEGQFYKKDLFFKIINDIDSFYDYRKMEVPYPREEVYFSTIANIINKGHSIKIAKPFNYSAYHFTHLWDVTKIEIDNLLSKECSFYSVKRVNRILNDNIRIYLRDRFLYGELEREILGRFGCQIHSYSNIKIVYIDICKYLRDTVHNIPKILSRLKSIY